MTKPQARMKRKSPSTIVAASLPASDLSRLDAFGERERRLRGLEARRGTLALMLIRKGLDAVEKEAAT